MASGLWATAAVAQALPALPAEPRAEVAAVAGAVLVQRVLALRSQQ